MSDESGVVGTHHSLLITRYSERSLVRAWQRGLGGALRTADGRDLAIVYRGRCPGGAGPDVRGALLAFDGGQLIEGDVEFHLRTSDWFDHDHHADRHYRAVVLHVVLVDDAAPPLDASGQPLPTLVLSPENLSNPGDDGADLSPDAAACHRAARDRGPEALGAALDDLGDRRLAQRAARFEADLTRLGADQLAYEALFDALGFSRNRAGFARLAQAVPLALLLAILGRREPGDALALAEAILFGVAGLLPSQRPAARIDWEGDAVVAELEEAWALYRRDWDGLGLGPADWTFGGVRLANYPTRRIATAARLIVRYQNRSLDDALLRPLRTAECGVADLEKLFLVDEPAGYWSSHGDFGQPLPGHPAALLGRDRAREAVVNVVLPLALAVAAQTDDRVLADAAWSAYRGFPRPSAYQATQRLSDELGLPDRLVGTARRQQGLLHLLRSHCERASCASCPLTAGEVGQ